MTYNLHLRTVIPFYTNFHLPRGLDSPLNQPSFINTDAYEVGNLYKKVKKQPCRSIVRSQGGKQSLHPYHDIDEGIKKELVDLLD